MKQTAKHIVRLGETDAAGRLYFASAFTMAHEVLEDALAKAGFPIAGMLKGGSFILPIVHAEADFKQPLLLGDKVIVELTLKKKSKSTLESRSLLKNSAGKIAAQVCTVHACIDKNTGRAISLPNDFLQAIA